MTKKEIIADIAKKTNQNEENVKSIVDALLDTIIEKMQSGEEVQLLGFGTFSSIIRKAREGRNPHTGEKVHVAERRSAKFKFSNQVKNKVK